VTNVAIRDATDADMPAVLVIYNHEAENGLATWDLEPRSLETQMEWLLEHQAPYCALVAESGREVVAWASLSRYRDRPGYRFTVEDTVYVRPDHHRRGIGRALLQELLVRGRAAGFHTVLGKIEASNVASIELHRLCGFVQAGRERELGFKFERWLDLVTMQRMLGG